MGTSTGVTAGPRLTVKSMRRLGAFAAAVTLAAGGSVLVAGPAQAHRDGCHRWHSCPSDSGSYVCGDLGYYSECPGTTTTVPEVEYDFDPPSAPVLSKVASGAGGTVSMTIVAERGSKVVVVDGERTVKKATGTGKAQRLAFKDRDGTHTYEATATDSSGNESFVSDPVNVITDATKPAVTNVQAPSPTAATGFVPFTFNSEPGAAYMLTVPGQPAMKGTVGSDSVRQVLWLRNGSYPTVLTVKDKVGNVTIVRRTVRVNIASPTLSINKTSPVNDRTVQYTLTGTPRSTGTITFKGLPVVPFRIDDTGNAKVTFTAADGTYPTGIAVMKDFAGRSATTSLAGFRVDSVKPVLTSRTDTVRAKHGALAVLFTAEEGARVVLTATHTGKTSTSQPATTTLTGTGTEQTWTPAVPAGDFRVDVTATDSAGNKSTNQQVVTVADPLTPAELIVGLLVLLLMGAGAVGVAVLAWVNRHRIRAWQQRRRQAAAAAAHQRAVAAAHATYQAALAAHRNTTLAYQQQDTRWAARASQLDHLVNLARHERGQPIPGFAAVKLKPGERVYTTGPGSLVEERSRSGVPVLTETCTGTVTVTNTRVLFDGPKNRQWVFDQLQRTDLGPAELTGTVIMTVASRKSRSGVRPLGDPVQAEQAHILLLAAIGDATGQRERLVRQLDAQRDAHRRSRPTAPPAPPVPALLQQPTPSAQPATSAHAAP